MIPPPKAAALLLVLLLWGCGGRTEPPGGDASIHAPTSPAATPKCRLETIEGVRVLTLSGTPEEMGRAHGELLGEDVRWVVEQVVHQVGSNVDNEAHAGFRDRVKVMERHLQDHWKRELRALSAAAGVDYWDLVALQLFGDVERAQLCSSFAVFGPATATGECIVGRNFDYWYPRVAERASIVIDYHPRGKARFVTLSWAGVINGWTLMNEHGIVAANNTAYSLAENSLEGVSTCFMLRAVAERAETVASGVRIVENSPRACATNLLIAGGNPPDAVILEYDHARCHARRARAGVVLATNSWLEHGEDQPLEPTTGRYAILNGLIRRNYGRITRTHNFIASEGVPLASINLHSALLFPSDLTLAFAMGAPPACEGKWHRMRMTGEGVEVAEDSR